MSKLARFTVLGLIVFCIFTVFFTTPQEDQFARQADEGYYFVYAKAVKDGGVLQLPALLDYYLKDKVLHVYPHPGRIGHTLINALWLKIFPETFLSLARLSWVCFILFLILSFFYSKKYFGRDFAYCYVLLLASNPLFMAAGRRLLQDSMLNLFWALSLWLFLDFLTEKKKRQFVLFLAVFSLSIMIKEASLALLVFFVAMAWVRKVKSNDGVSNEYFCGLIFLPPLIVLACYLLVFGGFGQVSRLVAFLLGTYFPQQLTNPYTLFALGPWYKYLIDFLMIAPFTLLLAIGYLFHLLFLKKGELKTTYFAFYLFLTFFFFGVLMKSVKIVRFVMSLEIAISLFALLTLYELFRDKEPKMQGRLVFGFSVAIFFMNYFNFVRLFLTMNIYDPISYWLLIAQRIIPLVR